MTPIESEILACLKEVEGNSSFAVSGVCPFIYPGLHVEGVGEIGFPINEVQAKALIAVARQAPFGRGSETITDTSVRKSWEIDADAISFTSKDWNKTLKKIVNQTKEGLGIEHRTVKASLYKLLIYEEGGFFLPHKDSEKEKGMFASLVIGLPATHTGGEFLVRFKGVETAVNFSEATNSFKIPYVAFYADCEHEIKPVQSGYRVCLVYNLLQQTNEEKIGVIDLETPVENLTKLLKEWSKVEMHSPKAILLEHEYTETNFSLETLKQHDQPRAEALLAAAEKAGYMAYLGLVEHHVSGELLPDHNSYRSRRRSWYYDDYDEPEEEEGEGEMGEIYETSTSVEYWVDMAGPGLGNLHLDQEEDVLTEVEVGQGEPSRQEQEGYTGNAGMTLDYWYYYGAIILWHKSQHFNILQERGIEVRLNWLRHYLKHWNQAALAASETSRNLIANLVIEENYLRNYRYQNTDFSIVAEILIQLKDEQFVKTTAAKSLHLIFEKIGIPQWCALLQSYPSDVLQNIFQQAGLSENLSILAHLLEIVAMMATKLDASSNKFIAHLINQIPTYLNTVKLHDLKDSGYYYYSDRKSDKQKAVERIVPTVLKLSTFREEEEAWRTQVLDCLTEELPRKYVNEVLFPALTDKNLPKTKVAKGLHHACVADFVERTAEKPTPPSNWTRPVPKNVSRDSNEYWRILIPFLKSPTQESLDYVKNQSYRGRMASVIQSAGIDVKMYTIERGRPYTLRITKTQASYEKALKEWKEDMKFLDKLKS